MLKRNYPFLGRKLAEVELEFLRRHSDLQTDEQILIDFFGNIRDLDENLDYFILMNDKLYHYHEDTKKISIYHKGIFEIDNREKTLCIIKSQYTNQTLLLEPLAKKFEAFGKYLGCIPIKPAFTWEDIKISFYSIR